MNAQQTTKTKSCRSAKAILTSSIINSASNVIITTGIALSISAAIGAIYWFVGQKRMDEIIESFGSNIVVVMAIICYTIYEICALRKQPTKVEKYEELRLLNELREKGVITQAEFDEKKGELLDWQP